MSSRIDGLLAHIAQLEREVEHELNRAREQWRYKVMPAASDSSMTCTWRTSA